MTMWLIYVTADLASKVLSIAKDAHIGGDTCPIHAIKDALLSPMCYFSRIEGPVVHVLHVTLPSFSL